LSAMSVVFAAIAAPLDPRLSDNERRILRTLAEWPRCVDIDDCIRHGDVRLRDLIAATRLPKPHVMYAVGRLEDLGYLPDPSVR
jgi:DNA-binding transcriptional ArsR family regulator